MKSLDSLPPRSNPFDYDMDRVGMEVGNFMVMYHPTTPEECIVVHVDTGYRVELDFSELKEYYNCMYSMYPFDEAGHDALNDKPFVLVCKECAPKSGMGSWSSKDTTGTEYHYLLMEDKIPARGILSCDICGE